MREVSQDGLSCFGVAPPLRVSGSRHSGAVQAATYRLRIENT